MRVTSETSDEAIEGIADALWPCIEGDVAEAKIAISLAGRAYRALLRSGQSPVQAVKTLSTIAVFVSGEEFSQVDGPHVKPKRGWRA
jgi:hypothetical protein